MSKKQTAIDWLIQALESDIKVDESNMVTIRIHEHDYLKSKQIALDMEKKQIIESYDQGDIQLVNAEQYFNETYK
jgi:ATP phosphoribosyltransferase